MTKTYTYSQFSFKSEGNEDMLKEMIRKSKTKELMEIKVDHVDPNKSIYGFMIIKRVFQWSNGNVTVIGDFLW